MAKKGEIVLTLSTDNLGPVEVKLEAGREFQKVLPDMDNPKNALPQVTEMVKETREALRALTDLVQVISEYRQDLKTLLQLVRAFGESKNDLQKIIGMWKEASSTSS